MKGGRDEGQGNRGLGVFTRALLVDFGRSNTARSLPREFPQSQRKHPVCHHRSARRVRLNRPARAVRIVAGKKADRRAFLELPAGSVLKYGQTSMLGRFSCASSLPG